MSTTSPSGSNYNQGLNADMDMKVELIVNERAEAMVLHDKPFTKELSWLEYDLDTSKLDFVMEDGDMRNFGIPVDPSLAKYLQNAYQILMVLMKDEKKENAEEEGFFPLIIHRA